MMIVSGFFASFPFFGRLDLSRFEHGENTHTVVCFSNVLVANWTGHV